MKTWGNGNISSNSCLALLEILPLLWIMETISLFFLDNVRKRGINHIHTFETSATPCAA